MLDSNDDIFLNHAGESMIVCRSDAQVELYYDNSKKFETTSNGATFLDNVRWNDNKAARFGGGDDLQIYHDGTNSFITNATNDLTINSTGDDLILKAADDAVIQVQGSENAVLCNGNGAVELYYDNVKKFETYSHGIRTTQNIDIEGSAYWDDNGIAYFGDSQDLQIYHDGTNSIIANTTGNLYILDDNAVILGSNSGTESYFKGVKDGAVELYYDNSKKFETTSIGAQLTGQFVVTSAITAQTYMQGTSSNGGLKLYSDSSTSMGVILDTGDDFRPTHNNQSDLGTSSYRWRNVYTNDLNLSNEGGSNDVDGTWGSYTIQEGAEDLFLVNKRSGKKYKFNLTEVA